MQISAQADSITTLEDQCEQFGRTISELNYICQMNQEKENQLKTDVEYKERELLNCKTCLIDATNQLKKASDKILSQENYVADVKKSLSERYSKEDAFKKEISSLKAELHEISNECKKFYNSNQSKDKEVQRWKRELNGASDREKRHEAIVKSLHDKLDRNRHELQHIRDLYGKLQIDYNQLKSQHDTLCTAAASCTALTQPPDHFVSSTPSMSRFHTNDMSTYSHVDFNSPKAHRSQSHPYNSPKILNQTRKNIQVLEDLLQ